MIFQHTDVCIETMNYANKKFRRIQSYRVTIQDKKNNILRRVIVSSFITKANLERECRKRKTGLL